MVQKELEAVEKELENFKRIARILRHNNPYSPLSRKIRKLSSKKLEMLNELKRG